MRVAIAGAGAVGRSIARELISNGHQVLLIDKEPRADPSRPGPRRRVAARRLLRALVAGGGPPRPLRRGHRRHRRRQGQPGHLAARQDRVRRAAHRRPGQPPQQRVAVHRGVGRRRQRLDPADHVGARRGGGHGRRPGAAVHVPPGQRQPGRDDAAGGLAVRREAGRADPVPGELRAGDDPARRPGLRARRRSSRSRPATSCCSSRRPRSRTSSSGCSPPAPTAGSTRSRLAGVRPRSRPAAARCRGVWLRPSSQTIAAERGELERPADADLEHAEDRHRGVGVDGAGVAGQPDRRLDAATRSTHGSTSSQVSLVHSRTTCGRGARRSGRR